MADRDDRHRAEGEVTSEMSRVSTLVSTLWLSEKLLRPSANFRLLDASWHMPHTKRNAAEEYKNLHIPDALFFDLDECADKSTDIDHMLPKQKQFEDYVGNLGINNSTHVVLYDNSDNFGLFSAQRVWWTFRAFGHDLVSIVDGGLPKWIAEGNRTTVDIPKVKKEVFNAKFRPELYITYDQMLSNVKSGEKLVQMADARPGGRFDGTAPEPRAGIKPGHILGAKSLPFVKFVNKEDKILKDCQGLREAFKEANIDLDKPMIATCGSGVTACYVALAAFLCGKEDVPVYDGSWTEWFLKADPEHKECVPANE